VWARTFTTSRHTGVPLEPRSLIADYEPATRALTVWISTQVPHMMQAVLAELFSLREQRVRVIAPDVGGSFGIKIHVYQDDMAACALAITLGRPVKFVASRRESFLSDIHAREQTIRVEVAADGDGILTAMRASITAALGPYSAYPRSSVVETPAPGIPGGFKGAGEAGATGAPAAILNAVNDALAPLDVMLTDQPITPERVVRALRRRK